MTESVGKTRQSLAEAQPDTSLSRQAATTVGEEPWEKEFKLGPEQVPAEQRQLALKDFQNYVYTQRSHFLGYQADQELDYTKDLAWMMGYHINNIGDPFTAGNFTLNSKAVEKHVLDFYAQLWGAKHPHDPKDGESYWGYVLTMGSTEGNMYGMWNARDYLAGKALILDPATQNRPQRLMWVQAKLEQEHEDDKHKFTPVAFFSEDTHYSLTKAMRVLGIKTFYELGTEQYPGQCPLTATGQWPEEVPSLPAPDGSSIEGPGTIDVAALDKLVRFFAARKYPVMICLNYGTTFKGAYDPVDEVIDTITKTLKDCHMYEREIEYGGRKETRYGFWIHVDGALGAAYMPFLKMVENDPKYQDIFKGAKVPPFDFSQGRLVFSISMSGHKWIGAPWPCGLFMTKVKYQLRPPPMPVYVGSPDTTFAGSRSGFSPLIFWDFLAKRSYADHIAMICEAQRTAIYAEDGLKDLGKKLGKDLYVARTPLALTVRFRQPNADLVKKYSLSTEEFQGWPKKYAHIFLLHGVTKRMVDELLADLAKPGAFEDEHLPAAKEAVAAHHEAEPNVRRLALVPTHGRGFR